MASGTSPLGAGGVQNGSAIAPSSWSTWFSWENLNPRRVWNNLNWQHLFWSTLLGLIVLTFNIDAFLRHIGATSLSDSWTGMVARGLGRTPAHVIDPTRGLVSESDTLASALALRYTLVLVTIYFLLVLLHAARQRGIKIISASVAGIIGGTLFLPVAVWSLVGAFFLWRHVLLPIILFVARIGAIIVNSIVAGFWFVLHQIGEAFAFLLALSVIQGLTIAIVGGIMIAVATKMPNGHPFTIIWVGLASIVTVAGLVPIVGRVLAIITRALHWLADRIEALLLALWEMIASWFSWLAPIIATLSHWLATAFEFLGWVGLRLLILLYVLVIIAASVLVASTILSALVLLLFALPGAMLIDQFKVAWHSGHGRAAVFNSSFSLGLSIALVLVVSGGNMELLALYDNAFESIWRLPDHWDIARSLATFWPESMEREILPYLSASQAPLFDGVLLLAAAGISCIGAISIWRLPDTATTSPYRLIFPTVILAALSAVLALAIAAALLAINAFGGSDA